jgi:hypothetical protein
MFDFLFGAKKRRKSCRRPATRRRYKSSNASCNRSTKKACPRSSCKYVSGSRYYGCIAAPGFANIVSGLVAPSMIPAVAQQVDEVARATAEAAVQTGATPAGVVAAAAAAAADVVVENIMASGGTQTEAVLAAEEVAYQVAQQTAAEVGLPPAEVAAVVEQTAQGIVSATEEMPQGTVMGIPAEGRTQSQLNARAPPYNPQSSRIIQEAVQRARDTFAIALNTETTGVQSVGGAIQAASNAAREEGQTYLTSRNINGTDLFRGMVEVNRAITVLSRESAAFASSNPRSGGGAPPITPPQQTASQRLRGALAGIAQSAGSGFGRRRSRFGSICTPFNNNEDTCLTKMVNNRYACIYKSNGSCSERPNQSYRTRDELLAATTAVNYKWYVKHFKINNVAGLANVYIPPTPPPVADAQSSEPYIFGSAQMAGPGPGRAGDFNAVAAYCKRFGKDECDQQLNCQFIGGNTNKCQARRGTGGKSGVRYSGPINRPGYRGPTPSAPPKRRRKSQKSGTQTNVIRDPLFDYMPARTGVLRDPLFDYMPAQPTARTPVQRDPLFDFMFGARRKSRKVSLNALKAKCRRLGVRTTSGKTRKPKTMAQLKRQCAMKQRSSRRSAPRRRRSTTTRTRRALPNCKGLTERMCGSNPNCQYTVTGCRRRYGTVANKAVYQGPQLPGFGRRRCPSGSRRVGKVCKRYKTTTRRRRRSTTTRRRRRSTTTRTRRALPNCKGLTERRCGSNPNCQYTVTGCRRRYGTVANKAVYQGPQLPEFGRRRKRRSVKRNY